MTPPLRRALSAAGAAALCVQGLVAQTPPQTRTPQAPPPCQVSSDPQFALTPEKAMQVGGGPLYMAARERRYLEALRGPAGQQITFRRLGQARAAGKEGILDLWEVTYEGLAKPISVYLDAYYYGDPKAPVGFTCVPFTLGPPPIDGFLATDLQIRLAIEQGSSRDFDPIPLGTSGAAHGVAFDRFRVIARAARVAAAAGTPLDAKNLPAGLARAGLMIVAYPIKCGDRVVTPVAIDVVPQQGQPPPRQAGPASGADLAKLLPGAAQPDGSIGVVMGLATLRPIDVVRIGYASEICDGVSKEVALPPTHTAARGVTLPQPLLPAGVTAPVDPVWLQVAVDFDGTFQQATQIGGPASLLDAALAAVRQWRAEPARINGAPVVSDTLLIVRFR